MTRTAWGAGLATIAADGSVLDTWYRWLGWGEFGDDDCPTDEIESQLGLRDRTDDVRRVIIRPVRLTIDVDDPPQSASDAYLRLHLLSHRLAAPRTLNMDGTFGQLNNVAWTNLGPVAVGDLDDVRLRVKLDGGVLGVHGLDKFPRMTDYVVPAGVRIADADRVRLGAHLAAGTTVMHEGFCNFNAGTLGVSMVEGRISAGVVVGDGSDIGGGSSIMGTLSGGGTEQITIGERCLLGANSGHRHQPRRRLRRRGRPVRHRRHTGAHPAGRREGPGAVGSRQRDVHPRRPVRQGRRPSPLRHLGRPQRRPPHRPVVRCQQRVMTLGDVQRCGRPRM